MVYAYRYAGGVDGHMYEALIELVGDPPAGLEPVAYLMALVTTLFIVSVGLSILWGLLDWLKRR